MIQIMLIYFEILYEVINYVDLFCTIKKPPIMLIYFEYFEIINYFIYFLNTS